MITLICILFFAAGHMVRDGWPSLGTTHGARALGAALCALPVGLISLPLASLVFAGILAGFYFDMKHGEGQGADNWASYEYLLISGVTSLIPLALTLELLWSPWGVFLVFLGVVKPPIWIIAWKALRPYQGTWFLPTRIATMVFGGVIGLVALLLHSHG